MSMTEKDQASELLRMLSEGVPYEEVCKRIGLPLGKSGMAATMRPHIAKALVEGFQASEVKWRELLRKAKSRINDYLDDDELSPALTLSACRLVLDSIIKSKDLHLEDAVTEMDEDPVSAILGVIEDDSEVN